LFPKFDPDVIIPKMMKSKNWPNSPYFGMKPNAIKAQWAANGKAASEAGTKMHEDIELYYNDVEIQNDSIEFEYFNNYLKDHSEFTPYRTEWTVWDKDSHICGSVDMIYINDDRTLSIYDWKRCKEIKMSNKFQKCLHPSLDFLQDCNYEHYSLQLNTYKYIIEKNYGFKVKELAIVCMHPDNDNGSYKKFIVRDLQKEVDVLFKEHIKNNVKEEEIEEEIEVSEYTYKDNIYLIDDCNNIIDEDTGQPIGKLDENGVPAIQDKN
jgi:hypothetical protein